jgi:hypothetical protein
VEPARDSEISSNSSYHHQQEICLNRIIQTDEEWHLEPYPNEI